MYGTVKMESFERVGTNVKKRILSSSISLESKQYNTAKALKRRLKLAASEGSMERNGENNLTKGKRLVGIFRGGTHFKGTGFSVA